MHGHAGSIHKLCQPHGERGERAYNGGLGRAPSGVQGQSPWSRGQRRSPPPPEAETTLAVGRQNEAAKVLPSSSHVYSKHSVTNQLLYYCDAPLLVLAPECRRH